LLGAFLWLTADHGSPAVFTTVVHENGQRTLAETVLYWRHFLRELPVAGAYAVSSLAAIMAYGPRRTTTPPSGWRVAALGGAVLVVAVAWAATTRSLGADVAWLELRQSYPTMTARSSPGHTGGSTCSRRSPTPRPPSSSREETRAS
jgi:hypothetical protein